MKVRLLALAFIMILFPGAAMAKDGDKALMLTVFGTSTGASITFDELVPMAQKRFPDRKIFVPYTSGVIRAKLNAETADPAKKILSPVEMLEKLKAEGYKDIAVVSTILFAGVEAEKLKNSVDKFSADNKDIKVSYTPPALSRADNLEAAVGLISKFMIKDGSNVVVAHGTHEGHSVEKTYLELAELVDGKYPNARVGSIEGVPDMERTLEWVKSRKEKDVRFIVFMFVAGDHAENDIASDEDDSLFTAVRKMGKNPSVHFVDVRGGERMASLGLDPDYRALLLDYYSKNVSR